jgi:hypothetical protein
MKAADTQRVQQFLAVWQGSQGNERANYQNFFRDWCEALGVEIPPPKGNVPGDPYCFDKEIKFFHSDRDITTRFADFYKAGHLLVEAKQGGDATGKGTAKRGTESYRKAMEKAFFQARSYAKQLDSKPPFLLTCDIGAHFELWTGFSGDYGGYGAREVIPLDRFLDEKVFDRFVLIFTDPQQLNPEKLRAKVTREVAAELATLAKWLERSTVGIGGTAPTAQEVSQFLMRCIFTMFAEDVELLKGEVFTTALRDRWIPNPTTFKPQIEGLWQTMNTGGTFGFEQILQFNGSFFAQATAFELPAEQLRVLLGAAEKDWSLVEAAIFGTLLERALDTKERSRLGAHYTPRSYVERLVRPVVLDPLRQRWELEVEPELGRLLTLKEGQEEPTADQRRKAAAEIRSFLTELRSLRVLDPACGSGNFLYVTLDLLKSLEAEAVRRLVDVTGSEQLNVLEQVNPSQFLGIEVNPRAAAIAELVIWIGYLQWHFKRFGNAAPPEPILQEFGNIEYRDAVLAWDDVEVAIDPVTGNPRTRWGGRMMRHPVTGKEVPDPSDQIPIYRYINPRPAVWPEADYIVSNPPFIGNSRMREALGDGYAEILRQTYKDVPDTVDFVMYWWHKAAEIVRSNKIKRFGFITTNSIHQVRQRGVVEFHLTQKISIRINFAIPDHPWTDGDAAVRIAMTVVELDNPKALVSTSKIGVLLNEVKAETPEESAEQVEIQWKSVGRIFSDLKAIANLASTNLLKANLGLSSTGVKLHGAGFILSENEAISMGYGQTIGELAKNNNVIKKYMNGRDFTGNSRKVFVIDFDNFSLETASQYAEPFQKVLESVKPERDINRDKQRRENWWLFGRSNKQLRQSLEGLSRYIATVETAKHRVFTLLNIDVLPDNKLIAIALNDSYFLGILSSRVHVEWALASGARLGFGNDPVYVKTFCFDPFPFPDPTLEQKQQIRELGERLDTHRKRVQAQHPDITLTGMYNLLEKLRSGEEFTDKDRDYNDRALVSTLQQIHDQLDAAVLAAYGWPPHLTTDQILENLVALNAQRAEEERNGHIRWLRPDYQAPPETQTQQILPGIAQPEAVPIAPAEQQPWPKPPKAQLAAIQQLLSTRKGEWTAAQVAAQFKGAARQTQAIQDNLDRLEWFGFLVSREDMGIKRWQIVETGTIG